MLMSAPLVLTRRPPALAEEKVARPCAIERNVDSVDSDEERLGLVEVAGLHLRPRQKVHGTHGVRLVGILVDDGPEPRRRGGKVAPLVRAERRRVVVTLAAGSGRRSGGSEGEQSENEGGSHETRIAKGVLCSAVSVCLSFWWFSWSWSFSWRRCTGSSSARASRR